MQVKFIGETAEFVNNLNLSDETRVYRVRDLLERFGFVIGPKYVKKVSKEIWELRAGRVRLLICVRRQIAICVHAFYKKSQKLPKKDLKLAERRCKQI